MPRRGKSTDLPLTVSDSSGGSSSPKQQQEHEQGSESSKSCCNCCCWLWVLLLLGVACLAGGLAWYLIPEDSKPALSVPGLGDKTESPTLSPPPTWAPTKAWSFNQCANNAANCCQGLDNGTCDLRVNQLLYGYMHNAVHTKEDKFLFPWNHALGLEKALEAGYRALELDVSKCGDDEQVAFYHARCALGTRDPKTVLKNIGDFVTKHPTEIVILMLQMPDTDVVSLQQVDEIVQTVSTIANRLYQHTLGTLWPTLQELIDADQRVVMFFKNQPNCRQQTCPSAAWHYWNDYTVETEWDFRSIQEIDDTEFSCSPNHGTTAMRSFYRVNAFTSLPSHSVSQTVNSYEYAQKRMATCANRQGQDATFYAVDFWDTGDVLQLVQDVNRQRAAEEIKKKQQAEEEQQGEGEQQDEGEDEGQGGGQRA